MTDKESVQKPTFYIPILVKINVRQSLNKGYNSCYILSAVNSLYSKELVQGPPPNAHWCSLFRGLVLTCPKSAKSLQHKELAQGPLQKVSSMNSMNGWYFS
jgi:hypothetical protein